MLQMIRARGERRRREKRQLDAELRREQEDAEQRLGVDSAGFETELDAAAAVPMVRSLGLVGIMLRRQQERRRRRLRG